MKRMICGILICLSLLSPLCQGARAASWGSAAEVVSTALSQLDYQEGERSYSLYGEWYGYPHGHWCDMFVSWCADQFSFSLGDSSYRGTPYTIRADLAAAVYALWEQLETPAKAERPVTVNGRKLAGPVLRIGEELYGPLTSLQKQFPRLSTGEDGGETAPLPAPAAHGDRVAPHQVSLERGKERGEAAAFWYRGELYVALVPTAELLHASLK